MLTVAKTCTVLLATEPALAFLDVLGAWKWAVVPLILAVIVFRRMLRPLKLGYLQAVPLAAHDLPADVREYFDSHDQPLAQEGFHPAGDYQTVHGSNPNYARFYAGAVGDLFIEVDVYRKMGGGLLGSSDVCGVTCVSVFEDGASLHTGNFGIPDGGAHAPPQLIYRGRPGLSLQELIAAHRDDAEACAADHGVILEYPPGQLAHVSVYYSQYQREFFVTRGVIPPPEGYEQTSAMVNAPEQVEEGVRA